MQGLLLSRKQPKEKDFQYEIEQLPFGEHAVIDLEYRNGEKVLVFVCVLLSWLF